MASNTIIQIKRSSTTATPSALAAGELAYSYTSNNLFIGLPDGTPVNIGGVSTLVKLQAAFDKANTAGSSELSNAIFDFANAAYAQANTATTDAANAQDYAESAYFQANTATTDAANAQNYAESAYNQANTATLSASYANDYAASAYNQANTATNNAASASLYANTALNNAASASLYANTGINNAASASLYANTGINNAASASLYANAAYDQANTATNNAASASLYANTGINNAASASLYANTGIDLAQAAFNSANVVTYTIAADSGTPDVVNREETITFSGGDGVTTSVSDNQVTIDVDSTVIRTSGGQTIDGSLAIAGDLIVSGNTVTQDVQTLVVEDSLIELAANNSVADSIDIGFFGQYVSGGTKYTTLMRDATDGKYKLLVGGTEKPDAANTVNVAAFSTGTLVANIEAGSVDTGTLKTTALPYLDTPAATSAFMYVDAVTGEVKHSFSVDGGSF